MNIPTLQKKIIQYLPQWVDNRIDSLVADNPAMVMVSAYLKRGARNYLSLNQERIGSAITQAGLFVADGQGDVNISTLFDDLKAMFQSLPLYPFDLGPLHGTIGKGEIRLSLPDNLFCNILFGNVQSVSIKADDFLVLRDFLLAPNSNPSISQ